MSSIQIMKYHVWVWHACGIWYTTDSTFRYKLYSAFVYAFYYIMHPICIAMKLAVTQNFEEIIEILQMLPIAAVGIKLTFVLLKRQQFNVLFDLMTKMDIHLKTSEHHQILTMQTRAATILVYILSAINYGTTACFCLMARLENRLPFPTWYPFSLEKNSILYHCIVIFQISVAILYSFVFTSIDMYSSAFYRILGAHIDVLALKLKQLHVATATSGIYANKGKLDLIECITYHKLCIRFVKIP